MLTGETSPIPWRPPAAEDGNRSGLDTRQLSELDALSERFFNALDLESRLAAICDFWVPTRADWLLVTLVDPNSGLAKIATLAHREPNRAAALLPQLRGQLYAPRERLFSAEPNAEIVLPLENDSQAVGMLHLGIAAASAGGTDAAFNRVVAARCAAALRNSLLYEEQRRISLTFQNAALATELPQVPGLRFDALYEAGQAEALVGGDWYDAFQVEDGRIVLSIGDVSGSGLQAAVAMMNVRQAIRGAAQVHPDPRVLLAAAERTLLLQHKDVLVTAIVAVIDPVTQHCSYSNAGHPPALVRASDGTVRVLRERRPPLGLPEFSPEFAVHHVPLPPGSLLLLYTDGLIESTKNVLEGEARLHEALTATEITVYDNVARRIHEVVLGHHSRDDVAILSVRIDSANEVQRWRFDPMWGDAAARVRYEILAELRAANFDRLACTDFEVIFSELMSNIIRYAPGTSEVILERQSDRLVLHVLDNGDGFLFIPKLPADLFSEYGRGLFLVANLAFDFSVEHRPGGGSHARVVLNTTNGVSSHVL